MAYCVDAFSINVVGGDIDADITIPGTFPLPIEPGAEYFIGFTYITGVPAATGWRIDWEVFDADFTSLPGDDRPSTTITPEVPDASGSLGDLKNGSVRGRVPSPTSTRTYVADVYILQA